MNYEFPVIKNIADVLPAIDGRQEFVVAEKDGYTVINYNVMFEDTFGAAKLHQWNKASRPPENWKDYFTLDRDSALRRECRGIIFDSKTGDIIRRPFHKFFNVNEREETQDHRIDLSRPHAILEKLDGSMIAPFIVNDEMIWGTKMGATDVAKPVEEFVKNNPRYEQFAYDCIVNRRCTPIFEWCSRKQRIVLDYKEDQLVLTAARDYLTGKYVSLDHLNGWGKHWDIPVVRAFEPQTNMKAFLDYVAGLEDLEGFVVRFDDGHMVKLKCHWYLQIHRAKEAILQDRNIVELILDEHLDDVKAHLPTEDRDRLTQFESDFNAATMRVVGKIVSQLMAIQIANVSRKDFALGEATKIDGYVKSVIFKLFDQNDDIGKCVLKEVHNTIRNNLSKTVKYEAIRDAWFPGVAFNG
jgi:RNA ligase